MKIKNVSNFLSCTIIFIYLIAGCKMKEYLVINYRDFQYMEVSFEEKGYIIIRGSFFPNSYRGINNYLFIKDDHKYYISFISKTKSIKIPTELDMFTQDSPWGLTLTLKSNEFNSKEDCIYYKDTEGEYKINIGDEATWKNYLEKSINSRKKR